MQDRLDAEIGKLREELGERLSIVAHHYQSDPIVKHSQVIGDSLELARKVATLDSENIVFCGVSFMAESAALLARPGQKVFLPAETAHCVMADMVPAELLDTVLEKLNQRGRKVLPLAYVNTSVSVKAVVGKYGGAVCTSANAEKMLRWAFAEAGEDGLVLFLPDKNLGRNTSDKIGLSGRAVHLLDISQGGENPGEIPSSVKLLLWPGYCPIHDRIELEDVKKIQAEHPGLKIAVHPECTPEVVQAADAAGSTSFLIKYAAEAPAGSVLGIGTEINLVRRLAELHAGRLTVLPLKVTACPDMGMTTTQKLLDCLQSVAGRPAAGKPLYRPASVNPAEAENARASLTRMLEASK